MSERRGNSWLRVGAVAAVAVSLGAVWMRAWPLRINDFGLEAYGAYAALIHGHPVGFLRLAPAYGGSLELRAPFALLAAWLGGGEQSVYRLTVMPCLLAGALLGSWLAYRARAWGAGLVVLAVAALNPLTYRALMIGHPEEVLGGVLCVVAVLCAMRGRAVAAGVVLGLAIANKQWALLAAGPVVLALPGRRGLAILLAGAVAAAFLLPFALVTGGGAATVSGRLSVTDAGDLFHPQQLWWFTGHPVPWVQAMSGQLQRGLRLPPDWLQGRAHMIVILIALPLTELARRRPRRVDQPLALLALLMLLRCALDPWDVVYYPLPFIFALLAWEIHAGRGAPAVSVGATAAAWLLFQVLPAHVDTDAQAAAFAALVLPATVALAISTYQPAGRAVRSRAAAADRPTTSQLA